jgi:hypothetical protein
MLFIFAQNLFITKIVYIMRHKILPLFVFIFSLFISAYSQFEIIEEEFMAVSSIKTPSFVIHFEYNTAGKVISEIKEAFDDDYLSYKFEYEYDETGNMTQQLKYHIYYTQKEENEYNDNNQITEKRIYIDYGTGLKFIEQKFYIYQDTLLETILNQVISSQGQNMNSSKQEFTYNKEQQLERMDNFDWVLGDWMHTEIQYFEYNDAGTILYHSSEILLSGDEFQKFWRFVFNYNNEGKLTERSYHIASNSVWHPKPLNRYVYRHEEPIEGEKLLFPNIYQFDELNSYWFQEGKKLVEHDTWSADCSGTPYFVESAHYLYKPVTIITTYVGIEEYSKDEIAVNIYPNPTTGELQITFPSFGGVGVVSHPSLVTNVEVFDVYGRKQKAEGRKQSHSSLVTCHENGEAVMDISELPAGIYFVKITTEQGVVMRKVVKV